MLKGILITIVVLVFTDTCSQRWLNPMSPGSMTMPTMSEFDRIYQNQGPHTPHTPQGRPPSVPNSQGYNLTTKTMFTLLLISAL